MVQLLPKVKSFGEEFGQELGSGLGKGFSQSIESGMDRRRMSQALREHGLDESVANLPKSAQEAYFKQQFKPGLNDLQKAQQGFYEERTNQLRNPREEPVDEYKQSQIALNKARAQEIEQKPQRAKEKTENEYKEKIIPFENGLKTLNAMRSILKKGNLGIASQVQGLYNKETREDRAKYSQLGKSLISLASTIPIRNQKEFETLAHDLYNPNNSDATNQGILDAMEQMINQSISSYSSEDIEQLPKISNKNEKIPLKMFMK